MKFRYSIRIHLGALVAFIALFLVALFAKPNGAPLPSGSLLGSLVMIAFMVFMLSWLWLVVLSWVMLIRSWNQRTGGENVSLLLILFFLSFFGAYYFYWKRYEIDPTID